MNSDDMEDLYVAKVEYESYLHSVEVLPELTNILREIYFLNEWPEDPLEYIYNRLADYKLLQKMRQIVALEIQLYKLEAEAKKREDRPGPSDENRPGPSDENRPGPSDENRPGPSDENRPGPSDENRPGSSNKNRPGPSNMDKPGSSKLDTSVDYRDLPGCSHWDFPGPTYNKSPGSPGSVDDNMNTVPQKQTKSKVTEEDSESDVSDHYLDLSETDSNVSMEPNVSTDTSDSEIMQVDSSSD